VKSILILILISISILSGCCSGKNVANQTFIRDTTYIKVPEWIVGSGTPQIVTDTLVEYVKIKGSDTIVKFQYLPAKRLIEYVVKPDTVFFQVRDTLYSTKIEERIIETPFMSKLGLVLAGIALGLIGIAIYKENKK